MDMNSLKEAVRRRRVDKSMPLEKFLEIDGGPHEGEGPIDGEKDLAPDIRDVGASSEVIEPNMNDEVSNMADKEANKEVAAHAGPGQGYKSGIKSVHATDKLGSNSQSPGSFQKDPQDSIAQEGFEKKPLMSESEQSFHAHGNYGLGPAAAAGETSSSGKFRANKVDTQSGHGSGVVQHLDGHGSSPMRSAMKHMASIKKAGKKY